MMKRRPRFDNNRGGGQGGGGQRRHHNPRYGNNRSRQGDDSGNVARIRARAHSNKEKYLGMAKDAMQSGDRVLAEYYFQHADHYSRVLKEYAPPEQSYEAQENLDGAQGDGTEGQGDVAAEGGQSNGASIPLPPAIEPAPDWDDKEDREGGTV